MQLQDLACIRTNFADADFWLVRRGSVATVGQPTKTFSPYHIGIKVNYAHLVEKRTGQKVSRMHLYYTGEESGNPYITFTKDDKSIGKTIGRFDEIVARIENKDYSMTARPAKLCVNCDMRSYCDNKSWKFRKQC